MTKEAKPEKLQKPTVFDDKSTGLKCLTLIIVAILGTMAFVVYLLPTNASTNAMVLALTNIISSAVGGIVGIVTGSKWAVNNPQPRKPGLVIENVTEPEKIKDAIIS
jgi:hypothetical protein